jgi:hypothetical protein
MRGLVLGVIAICSVLSATTAFAQPPTPGGGAQRPTFSPYLNLLNRNFSPAGNYFGFVRPQQQMQQQFGQLQSQLNTANQSLMGLQAQGDQLANELNSGFGLRSTANVATFMNTGHYFSYNPALMGGNRGGMGGGFGGMGPQGGGMAQGQIPQSGSLPGGGQVGANRSGSRANVGTGVRR